MAFLIEQHPRLISVDALVAELFDAGRRDEASGRTVAVAIDRLVEVGLVSRDGDHVTASRPVIYLERLMAGR